MKQLYIFSHTKVNSIIFLHFWWMFWRLRWSATSTKKVTQYIDLHKLYNKWRFDKLTFPLATGGLRSLRLSVTWPGSNVGFIRCWLPYFLFRFLMMIMMTMTNSSNNTAASAPIIIPINWSSIFFFFVFDSFDTFFWSKKLVFFLQKLIRYFSNSILSRMDFFMVWQSFWGKYVHL